MQVLVNFFFRSAPEKWRFCADISEALGAVAAVAIKEVQRPCKDIALRSFTYLIYYCLTTALLRALLLKLKLLKRCATVNELRTTGP